MVTLIGAARSRVHLHTKTKGQHLLALVFIVFLVKIRPLASLEFFVAAECAFAHLTPKNSAQR